MNDICTGKLAIPAGTVVKKDGGNAVEGKGQLLTWMGAGIIKIRQLLTEVNEGKPPPPSKEAMPLLGWTVVGHRWELYAAAGIGNGAKDPIWVFGPMLGCTIETMSWLGAFKLLQLVERVKEWTRDVYWPWFCKEVMAPLTVDRGVLDAPKEATKVIDE